MIFSDWLKAKISNPRGAWTRLDQIPVRPERASLAENVRYEPQRVKTREGYTSALTVTGKVTTMFQWLTSIDGIGQLNRLMYLDGGTALKMYDFVYETSATMISGLTAAVAKIVEAGTFLFAAFQNTAGQGATEARVVYPLFESVGEESDIAFGGECSIVPVVSETGAGLCDGGAKLFNYLVETRSGFTRLSAASDVEFTVTAAGKALRMEVDGSMPSDAAYIHPIMTTTANHYRWFLVPDAAVSVTPGVEWTATMNINISDDDLANFAETADDILLYLARSGGTGPFNPSSIVQVGRRLAYFVNYKVYVSEIDNFQSVSEDQHVIYLPGRRQVVTGFQKRGVFYILGPNWTHAVVDNGDLPVLWAPPELVSGAIGTTAVHGVEANTGGTHAWVASPSGLYLFDGAYSDVPISFLNQPEWDRINWAAPYAIFTRDDFVRKRVMVAAPLDSATTPTHVLTWDYSRGNKFTEVDFSLNQIKAGSIGSIEMVQDLTTGRSDVWVGPAAAGNILKSDDSATEDDGTAIVSKWRSGMLLAGQARKPLAARFGGAHLDVRGNGVISPSLYKKGGTLIEAGEQFTLDSAPEEELEAGFDSVAEDAQIQIETNTAAAKFDFAGGAVYYKPELT